MAITEIADWQARLRGRVFAQFAQSNWCVPLADLIGAGANELELAFAAVLLLWSIDTVTNDATSPLYGVGRGVQLDRIGRLVGQPRAGVDDDHYRFYLRAKIRANRSDGTPDVIIGVFQAMLGATELPVYYPGGNASFFLRLTTPITDAVAEIALYFLGISEMGGVRGLLGSQVDVDAAMFYTPVACYGTGAASAGDATIDVVDASWLPDHGIDHHRPGHARRGNAGLLDSAAGPRSTFPRRPPTRTPTARRRWPGGIAGQGLPDRHLRQRAGGAHR
jgi:hypothetical protein